MTDAAATTCEASCVSRRLFLASAGAATATVLLGDVFPGRVLGQDPQTPVERTELPKKRIAALSELQNGQAVEFAYPADGALNNCVLVKLGEQAGGGVGAEQDIVAFSARCTHMGGSLDGLYKPGHQVLGPCGEHLTTFDLTCHGMVVAGHATQALPQIILEVDGDGVVATGIVGLLYGRSTNV